MFISNNSQNIILKYTISLKTKVKTMKTLEENQSKILKVGKIFLHRTQTYQPYKNSYCSISRLKPCFLLFEK